MAERDMDPDVETLVRDLDPVQTDPSHDLHQLRRSLRKGLLGRASPPTRLSRYELGRRIGTGGMGVVFEAQDPELQRTVAIKIIETPTRDSRLHHEARSLAKLSHPGIVPVFDVGAFKPGDARELGVVGGGLYIVMARIKGSSWREWACEQLRRRDAVVEVAVHAGEGLAAAHDAGIVHGDVKPENVMVSNTGRAIVLDFGLARHLDRHTGDEEGAGKGGTPGYMPPEAWFDVPADPSRDQYAFCVSLFEMLAVGYVADAASARQARTAERAAWPADLRQRIPRPLAETLRRGMDRRAERRWPSMAALLDQLRLRQTSGSGWRFGALASVALTAGGLFTWTAIEDPPPCGTKILDGWTEAAQARLMLALTTSGAAYSRDTWARTRDGLTRYAQRWEAERTRVCSGAPPPPDVRRCLAAAQAEWTAVIRSLHRPSKRAPRLAVTAVAALPPPEACALPEASLSLEAPPDPHGLLAQLTEARALGRIGRYEESIELAAAVLAEARTLGDGGATASALVRIGQSQDELGDYDDAAQNLGEAYFAALAAGENDLAVDAASLLVFVEGAHRAETRAAETWARHAAALVTAGHAAPGLSCNVGALHDAAGRYREAASEYRACIRSLAADGPGREIAMTTAIGGLGGALLRLGDTAGAREQMDEALRRRQALLGRQHPLVGLSHHNLGVVLLRLGRVREAETHTSAAVQIAEQSLDPDDPHLSRALGAWSEALVETGDHASAYQAAERAVVVRRRALGADHPHVAKSLTSVGHVLALSGRWREAEQRQREALEIQRAALDTRHPELALLHYNLGESLRMLGRLDDAWFHQQTAHELWTANLGDAHLYSGLAQAELGRISRARGEVLEAEASFALAADAIRLPNATAKQAGSVRADWADALRRLGRGRKACRVGSEAVELLREALPATAADLEDLETEQAQQCAVALTADTPTP
ncbi:MAG: serine/threonine-protein kinase [Myxococcota bacterium]